MNILISYFYQIRFFKPYMIPLSTAMWSPKWFNDFKGRNYKFKDKNGVWNGLHAEPFVPDDSCNGLCRGPENCATAAPDSCPFLKQYRKQLDALDFENIMGRFEAISKKVKDREGFEEEPVPVLIVHEAPNNPCSERWAIMDWFKDNGYILKEFQK